MEIVEEEMFRQKKTNRHSKTIVRELFQLEITSTRRNTTPDNYFVFKGELSAAHKKIKSLESKVRSQAKIAALKEGLEGMSEDQQIDKEKTIAFKEINWITYEKYNAIQELVPEFPSLSPLQKRKRSFKRIYVLV